MGKQIYLKELNFIIITLNIRLHKVNIKSTIAHDFEAITVKMNNKIIKIIFWDSVGYENGINLFSGRYKRNCKAYLISYDALNRNSFIME